MCLVHDLNLSGCNKGAKALFIPKNQESEHQSIKFIALNCDIKKPVIHINGAVTCTYSGSELFVDLEKEREEQTDEMKELEKQARYKPQYEKAAKKPLIWSMKEKEGVRFYYRIDKKQKLPDTTGRKINPGELVTLYIKFCRHAVDGTEQSDEIFVDLFDLNLEKSPPDYLMMMRLETA